MFSSKKNEPIILTSEEHNCWPEKLTSSLAKMQQSGTLCDLVLACKDGSVMAHSNVLASVSSVVEEICHNSNNNRTFQLPNISHHTMEAVIHFAYYGVCSVPQEQLIDLGLAASHLKITSLANSCEAIIKEIPKCDNSSLKMNNSLGKKVNKNNKPSKNEEVQTIEPSAITEDKNVSVDTSVSPDTLRKSSRKRKTSQKLIEAISDSRPRARRRVLNKGDEQKMSECTQEEEGLPKSAVTNDVSPIGTCKKVKSQRQLRSTKTVKRNTLEKKVITSPEALESKMDAMPLTPPSSNDAIPSSPDTTKTVDSTNNKMEKTNKWGKIAQVRPDSTGNEINAHAVVIVEKLPVDKIPEKAVRQHQCTYCEKIFKFKHRLEKHVFSAHTRVRPYKCSSCDLTFASKKEWNNHSRDHALAVERGDSIVQYVHFKGYLCSKCKKRYPRPEELDSHQLTCTPAYLQAPADSPVVATEANEEFVDDDKFFDSLADVSKLIKIKGLECYSKRNGKFVCEKCGKMYPYRHAIERHLYGEHDHPRPYHCGKCDKPFSTRAECARHLQDHDRAEKKGLSVVEDHIFKGYLCMRCLLTFDLPLKLDDHKKICRTEPIACKHCGKQFKKQCILKKHVTDVHTEKTDLCPECNKMVSNLNAHRRVHTSRKYTCTTCAKVFNRADNLRVHERIHTGDKPFPCPQCDERFRLKCLLKAHLKRHQAPETEEVPTTMDYTIHQEFTELAVMSPAIPQNVPTSYEPSVTQFTSMPLPQSSSQFQEFPYNASVMPLEDPMQLGHFIGQPQAQKVVLEESSQPHIISGTSNVSEVPQPSTYLTL